MAQTIERETERPIKEFIAGQNRSLAPERAWLRAHGKQYPGQWIALKGETFIAASKDLDEVHEVLRSNPDFSGALVHFQPE